MKRKGGLRSFSRFLRVSAALAALVFVAWHHWQRQNGTGAAVWAAGTDRID